MYDRLLLPPVGCDSRDTADSTSGDAVGDRFRNAIRHVGALAAEFDATIHVLHVVSRNTLPPGVGDARIDDVPQPVRQTGKRIIRRVTHRLETSSGRTVEALRVGFPADVIVDYAIEENIDMIVMRGPERSRLHRLLSGSVSTRVARTASVPVVTAGDPVAGSLLS